MFHLPYCLITCYLGGSLGRYSTLTADVCVTELYSTDRHILWVIYYIDRLHSILSRLCLGTGSIHRMFYCLCRISQRLVYYIYN